MGSSAAMRRSELQDLQPLEYMNFGAQPHLLSLARGLKEYRVHDTNERSIQRTEFVRKAFIEIFGRLKSFRDIVSGVAFQRESYENEEVFSKALIPATEIRAIIIEVFGDIKNAQDELAMRGMKPKSVSRVVRPVNDEVIIEFEDEDEKKVDEFHDICLEEEPAKPKIERLKSCEVNEKIVREAADYYRELFGNTMHFMSCNTCDFRQTARQMFKTGDNFVSLAQMDQLNDPIDCPCCKGKMNKVYNPEGIFKNFREKLMRSQDSFLSILRRGDNTIGGLAFAYITTLGRERELEWGDFGDPYMRAEAHTGKVGNYTEDVFLKCLNDEIFRDIGSVTKNTKVLAWNCISVSPDMSGQMLGLTADLFYHLPRDRDDLLVLGDVKIATEEDKLKGIDPKKKEVAYRFFKRLGGKEGRSFFGPEADTILIGGKASDALKYFDEFYSSIAA